MAAAPNRNLRILECRDAKQLVVEFEMKPTADEMTSGKSVKLRSTFKIALCWLYLFDTEAAMLEVKLEHEITHRADGDRAGEKVPLNLRMVLKLQDIVRRVYAPYWDVFPRSDQSGSVMRNAGHCPQTLTL